MADKRKCNGIENGRRLNILVAVLANSIAEGMDIDNLELLSSFMQLVGEALGNIAAAEALCQNDETIIIND